MKRSAEFSRCRQYRYSLTRFWNESLPILPIIGLNPSTADEITDDPTIRRCIGFARSWGYGCIVMLNLFALRATDPKVMKAHPAPIGDANDDHLMIWTRGRRVLCAWGANGSFMNRDRAVLDLLADRDLVCLGTTKAGHPKHPLYIRGDTQPVSMHANAARGSDE